MCACVCVPCTNINLPSSAAALTSPGPVSDHLFRESGRGITIKTESEIEGRDEEVD